jgi:hypothetical protein
MTDIAPPVKKLTAKERAERRKQRLMNNDGDRLKTILGDRIAPGDDLGPSKSPVDEANSDNTNSPGSGSSPGADFLGADGIPDFAKLAEMVSGGNAGENNRPIETFRDKIMNNISDFIVALFLVLINNGILNGDHFEVLKDVPDLTTSKLLLVLFLYNVSKYFIFSQNYNTNGAFRGGRVALNFILSPTNAHLLLLLGFICMKTAQTYFLLLVLHVFVYNFFTGGQNTNREVYEEEVMQEL